MMHLNADPASTPMRILSLLRAEKRLSRVEITGRLSVTQATVTNVVKQLLEAGLVREAELEHVSRGAPRRLLELVADAWYSVGIQLDQTSIAAVVVDFAGNLVAATRLPGAGKRDPQIVVPEIAGHVERLAASAKVPHERLLGVGIATYGPQDRDAGTLHIPMPTPAWRGFPLTKTLSDALGMKVIIENDATAAAIGELAIAPDDEFAVLYMSTGVGGAVIVGGRPFRGRSSNAVEIDHLPIVGGVRTCICGRIGCVGAEAQPLAVALIAAENPALKDRWGLSGAHDQGLADFERIARAAVAGDKDAVSLLHDSADALAVAVAAMFSFFDVDHLVLTGPAFVTAGPIYRDRIATSVRERIWHQDLHNPTIRVGGDVERSAATGAALQVLRIMMPNNPDGV